VSVLEVSFKVDLLSEVDAAHLAGKVAHVFVDLDVPLQVATGGGSVWTLGAGMGLDTCNTCMNIWTLGAGMGLDTCNTCMNMYWGQARGLIPATRV